jgi:hypothetical protein
MIAIVIAVSLIIHPRLSATARIRQQSIILISYSAKIVNGFPKKYTAKTAKKA